MTTLQQAVSRTGLILRPDSTRVLLRPFIPANDQRVTKIIGRVMSLSDAEVKGLLDTVMEEFAQRHTDTGALFERHYRRVAHLQLTDLEPERSRRLLIGSYFTSEYALECAALFNPSAVPHPNQEGVPPGALRFIMSLRATGEGHISSIEFREGLLSADSTIHIEPTNRFVTAPDLVSDPSYEKPLFRRKLDEMGFREGPTATILDPLPENFTYHELQRSLAGYRKRVGGRPSHEEGRALDCIMWLAKSNYEVLFHESVPLSERIIFPVSDNESNGIEDARFVHFTDESGDSRYYATYTAYNGRVILPQILETTDFLHFKVSTLNGRAVQNKGMALFPRRIDGRYAMISRQDNENLFIMYSDNTNFWEEAQPLMRPTHPWEFVQLGNCGSPIETEAGWLLLTHGVGAMRKYCIGAILLDLHDPGRVIGRLTEPLLSPNQNEREGYVPNVVYTCGALVHAGKLVMPYAMSDSAASIAIIPMDQLLEGLLSKGPNPTAGASH
jgi:predicted GH43/DUF377 family glycosyl hydrolase